MPISKKGIIFDIKHYAIHDGPGIRTTVFLKGCPLQCKWCANPESQNRQPELMYTREHCKSCLQCVEICPQSAIKIVDGAPAFNRTLCNACGLCVTTCPHDALEMNGYDTDVESLWEKIKDDRIFWDKSGGGVTLSGGEPLLQPDFTKAFLSWCKKRYVHTAIETCGHVSPSQFDTVLPLVNLVIFDLKLLDPDAHKRHTGVSNQKIIHNLRQLLKTTHDVLVRMPLIPGYNNLNGDINALGKLLESSRKGGCLEVLLYHRFGEAKYAKLDRSYELKKVQPPSREMLEQTLNILKQYDLHLLPVSKGLSN